MDMARARRSPQHCPEPQPRLSGDQAPGVKFSPCSQGLRPRCLAALTMGSTEVRSAAMGTGLWSPYVFFESTATTCSSSLASAPRQICRVKQRPCGREPGHQLAPLLGYRLAPTGSSASLRSHRSQQDQVLQEVIVLLHHEASGACVQLAACRDTASSVHTCAAPPVQASGKPKAKGRPSWVHTP